MSSNGVYNVVRLFVDSEDNFRRESYGSYMHMESAITKAMKVKRGCVVMCGADIVYPTDVTGILETTSPEIIEK